MNDLRARIIQASGCPAADVHLVEGFMRDVRGHNLDRAPDFEWHAKAAFQRVQQNRRLAERLAAIYHLSPEAA